MTDSTASPIASVERELTLRQSPNRVWRAITDPDEIAHWFGSSASIDLRPGGAATFSWEPGHEDGGAYAARIERVDPPHYLAYRWARDSGVAVDDGPSTLVEFDLEPTADGGTLLRLRESGFVAEADRAGNDAGWTEELAELVAYLGAR